MFNEAIERLEIIGAKEEDTEKYRENEIPCYYVNHDEKKIIASSLTKEQQKVIEELEKDEGPIVYYAIIDNGIWPDGEAFERWSFLTVSRYEDDWEYQKDSINELNCVPAYIYNCEEPDYSEKTEMPFRNMNDIIINVS